MNQQMTKTFMSGTKSVEKLVRKHFHLWPADYLSLDVRYGEKLVDGGGFYVCVNVHYPFPFGQFDMDEFKRVTERDLPELFYGDRSILCEITDRDYYSSDECLKASYYLKPNFA